MNKNKTLKKVAVMLLIIIMEFGGFPVSLAFAQDGLTFETPTPSASDSAAMPVPQVSVSPELMSNPLLTEDAGTSAHFRPKIFVQQLLKRSFQAKEEVQVVVKNSGSDDLNLSIQGGTSEPAVEKTTMNGDTIFTIHPVASFRPGKYAVKVTDTTSNTVLSTQQFTWGVLAINTDKSIYLPGETANIAMAVLDEGGNMVCTAQVDLEIDSPNGAATKLSTTDGSIVVNPECRIHNFTMKPDYEASYKTAETGRYVTTLTATTQKGSYMVKDRFEVRHSVPFDVTRDTATRVYPAHVYPVQLHVRAQEDFSGKIVETVPTDFQISQLADNSSLPYAQENDIPQNTAKEKNPSIPNLRLPFDGHYQVTLGFGQQVDDPEDHSVYKKSGLDGHDGIDFGLPENTPVLAVDDGKVVLAQENWIYGTSVVIQHRWGRTYYGHLSKLSVTVGQQVTAGTEIGLSGHTGLATGPHLHFGMKPNTSDINNLYFGKIDPAPYFGISSDDPVLSVSDYPGATMALVWNVNVQKGAEFTLGYQYKAPNKSPNFYTIGPLQFISSKITPEEQARFDVKDNPFVLGVATSSGVLIPADQKVSKVSDITTADNQQISNMVVFEEIRPWQLAIDAATTIIITSSYTDPCGSNCWTVPSDWNDSNNTIEVVGPGGNGSTSTTLPGSGGGGGGYAAKASSTATSFTPGASISFQIGTGGSGSATWFSTSAYLSGGAGGNGTNGSISSGGAGSGTAATTTSSGGTGADSISSVGSGGGGGGGAGGPNGAGHNGGTPITQAGGGGGGGGGNGGGSGSNGSNSVSASGGNGGNGNGGTGGGTGGTGIGGNATAGTGGGGAGGAGTTAAGGAFAGGNGAAGTDMAGGSVGTGGGGGGGGGNSRTTSTGNNGGAGGIPTADSGAGGGGGGDCTDAGCTEGAGKTGANGFIVITYTPLITGPTLDQLMRHGDWFSSGVRKSFTF